MKKLTSLLGFLVFIFSFAQGQIAISVLDETNLLPIPDVNISVKGMGYELALQTDARGRFMQGDSIPADDTFFFTHPDFEPASMTGAELKFYGYRVFLNPLSIRMEEVVLTASKFLEKKEDIPQQIQVIDKRRIEFINPQTSADLLTQSGGVFVQKSQQGGGSPNLRGFEANKVLIVVDGIRLNNAIFRGGHLQNVITIDPNMVERTEILFGPASVMYGSDALGGVMHFYSRRPKISSGEKSLVTANAFTRYSSVNNERTGHFDLNFGLKKWAFLSSISGSVFDDLKSGKNHHPDYPNFGSRDSFQTFLAGRDTVLANADPYSQIYSGYKQLDLMQKVLFLPNSRTSHLLNFQYSTSSEVPRYDRLSQRSGGTFRNAEWYYGPQKRLLASYHGNFQTKIGMLETTVAYQNLEESRNTRRFGQANLRSRTENVQVYSLNVDGRKTIGKNEWGYGIEATLNQVASSAFSRNIFTDSLSALDTRYPDGGSSMRFLAAYASYHREFSEKLVLSTGIRATSVSLNSQFANKDFFPFLPDEINQEHFAPSGNIGLVYRPDNWRFSMMGATGFRAPNVDDVGKIFDSSPGNVIVPNADVKPEYTYTAELGIERRFGNYLKIEGAAWHTWYRDALVVRDFTFNGLDSIQYDGVLSNVQANVNAKTAILKGFTFGIEFRPAKGWAVRHQMTMTYGQDTDQGVPLDHIPPLFGRTGVQYNRKRLQAEVFSIYNGWKRLASYSPSGEDNQVFATADGTYAWYTLNIRAGYGISENLRLQAGVDNIFDAHYRHFASGISAGGRNFYLTLRLHL